MPLLDSLLNIIAPHECLRCGSQPYLVCGDCAHEFAVVPPRCYRCLRSNPDSLTCQKCRRSSKLTHVWATTEYNGLAEELIHFYKFERALSAAKPIASEMLAVLPYFSKHVVSYLPTSPTRVRTRGYDQAKVLAKAIAKEKQLLYSPLLARVGSTRQVGASRDARRLQALGMFRIPRPTRVAGQKILLVDDILTTGASLETAAMLLKQHGAKQVDAVVFAQKTVMSQ